MIMECLDKGGGFGGRVSTLASVFYIYSISKQIELGFLIINISVTLRDIN